VIHKKGYNDRAHQTRPRATAAAHCQQYLEALVDYSDAFTSASATSLLPCAKK